MPDCWTRIVADHFGGLELPDDERDEVIEEVAAHLRECAEELEGEGATDATERALAQVSDWPRLAARIRRAKEERMAATSAQRTPRFWTLASIVGLAVLIGAAGGLVTSWLTPARYRSTGIIQVRSSQTSQPIQALLRDIQQRMLSRTPLEQTILEFNLYSAERTSLLMEEVVEQFRDDISLRIVTPDAISVSYVGRNPVTVMRVTEKLLSFVREAGMVEAERSNTPDPFKLLEAARVPERPFAPVRSRLVGIGALLGLAAGLLLALLARFFSTGRPQPMTQTA